MRDLSIAHAPCIKTEEEFEGRDDRPGVQGDFGERDDCHADDDEDGEECWVAGVHFEDIASNLVLDVVAEHEEAYNCHEEVEAEGEDVGDIDASTILVGMPHVSVYVGKDTVATPW